MKTRIMTILCIAVLMVIAGCSAPSSFVKTSAGWKTIEFNENIKGFDVAWQKCVDTIARDYDIEMMDKNSGYMRTAWIYGISGGTYNRYRGRITVKFSELVEPTFVDIKTEAQWLSNESSGQWTPGFDKNFQRDVYTALSGRLGRTVAPD